MNVHRLCRWFAATVLVVLAGALLPAAASARDCGKAPQKGAPGPVPAQAAKLFSLMKDAPTRVSEKRRRMICGFARELGVDPAQARRIASPMGRKGAWFLVPGTKGMIVDTGGGGAGATYAAIRARGWFGYFTGTRYLGAAVDGNDAITGTGPARDGSPVTFTAPIRHNVFVLDTPGANPGALTIALSASSAG